MKGKKNLLIKKVVKSLMFLLSFVCAFSIGSAFINAAQDNSVPEGYTAIRTIDDLYAINENPKGNYILMNDIDMSETREGGAWDFGNGWQPIDSFSGVFDGNGHDILNLNIFFKEEFKRSEKKIGLFSHVSGIIKNLGLKNFSIFVSGGKPSINVGGITGSLSGTILSCYVEGKISGKICNAYLWSANCFGGIAGFSEGIINNCYSNTELSLNKEKTEKYYSIGGIVGFINSGKLINCYSTSSQIYGDCLIGKRNSGSYQTLYFLGNNTDTSEYGTVLNAIQMQKTVVFQGFDFVKDWIIDSNSGYPYPQLLNCMHVKINSASLSALPSKKDYLTTDKEISIDGIYWDITYENGKTSKIPVVQEMLEYEMKPGEQTVKVRLGQNEESFTINVKKAPCEINVDEATIKTVGETLTINPVTNSDGQITYSSESYGKASVNSSGKIVFNQAGKIAVTISVSETDLYEAGKKIVYYEVKGITPYISVKEEFQSKVGEKIALNVKTDSDGVVSYLSSRPDVVSVDSNGKAVCNKPGSAIITIKTSMTLLYEPAETSVPIMVSPSAKETATNTLSVYVGQEIPIETVFENYAYNIKKISPEVTKGDKLVKLTKTGVKAVKKGNAVITASYKDYTYTCEVSISKAPKAKAKTYTVNGQKLKMPKGFFDTYGSGNSDDYKYFSNNKNNSMLIIQVDSSLTDTTYLSDEECEFVITRLENDSENLTEAMTGMLKQVVLSSDYSSKNLNASEEKTRKGIHVTLTLQKKDGSMLYYNYLLAFSEGRMISVSFLTYDAELSKTAMDYIIKKNKL